MSNNDQQLVDHLFEQIFVQKLRCTHFDTINPNLSSNSVWNKSSDEKAILELTINKYKKYYQDKMEELKNVLTVKKDYDVSSYLTYDAEYYVNEYNDRNEEIKKYLAEKNYIQFLKSIEKTICKTTFTRKLIQKFNNNLRVTSPTFTGMHLYEGLNFDFYNYDLYQVGLNLEEFEDILGDEKKKLIFFEWAENLDDEIKNTFTNPETLIQTIKINVLENEERVFTIN